MKITRVLKGIGIALLFTTACYATIPLPDMILFGEVFDKTGTMLTVANDGAVEITVKINDAIGPDDPVIATTVLQVVENPNADIYILRIPRESGSTRLSSDATLPGDVLHIFVDGAETHETEIGTPIVVTGELADVRALNLNDPTAAPADSDNDGIPDFLEQLLIDLDPNDEFNSFADINPGDDFDNDGETNLAEFLNGTRLDDPFEGGLIFFLTLNPGWNLFSIPINPSDPMAIKALQGAFNGVVWGWDGTSLKQTAQIEAKKGYFAYRSGPPIVIQVAGFSVDQPAITLQNEWNLVGQVSDPPFLPIGYPLTTATFTNLNKLRNPIWKWFDEAFRVAVNLEAGKGYWAFREP